MCECGGGGGGGGLGGYIKLDMLIMNFGNFEFLS